MKATRVSYTKRTSSGVLLHIIADFEENGTSRFYEQEAGDVRWFPHAPDSEERQLAEQLRNQSETD